MVFSSVDFLFLFLPVFLLAQFFLPYRNATFVVFSAVFYFIGEGWYTGVIAVSVVANYVFGLAIDRAVPGSPKKWALGLGVSANLALLFFFKYAGFFAVNFAGAVQGSWITSIHLPLGISFFTFHAISYLVDIYRHDAKAERSFVNLSLYMLMFPQLIAGPILRFHTVARQLKRRVVTGRNIYYGGVLFCFGLGQKVLLADTMASVADPLFARWQTLSPQTAWLATIAYALQIFFDFAGYSNMAIGLGWITGFHFPRNFNYPYISKSITEFWQRWHMSLSRWFRDYLYIPLGGNRHGNLRTYRNLMIVFLLCGLWHGAAWTFVLWGAYYGLLLVIERLGFEQLLRKAPTLLQHAYALLAIAVGWVLFRSNTMDQAAGMLGRMFFLVRPVDVPLDSAIDGRQLAALIAAIVLSTPVVATLLRRLMSMPAPSPWPRQVSTIHYAVGIVVSVAVLGASAVKVLTGSYSPFIYFRF
jgi:alginate O-acetyltransferase complex protein AlgI